MTDHGLNVIDTALTNRPGRPLIITGTVGPGQVIRCGQLTLEYADGVVFIKLPNLHIDVMPRRDGHGAGVIIVTRANGVLPDLITIDPGESCPETIRQAAGPGSGEGAKDAPVGKDAHAAPGIGSDE